MSAEMAERKEAGGGGGRGGKGSKREGGTEVGVSYKILRVSAVDPAARTFDAEVRVYLRWNDESLIGADPDSVDWDSAFNPGVHWNNGLGIEENDARTRLKDPSTGRVASHVTISGTFFKVYDLANFPYDTQRLEILVGTKKHKGKVVFTSLGAEKPTAAVPDLRLAEWEILGHDHEIATTVVEDSDAAYSHYSINVSIKRFSSFFNSNVVAFSFLLVLANAFVAAIHPADFGDRLGVTLTILLTLVALRFSVGDSLPKIGYLTLLDYHLLASSGFTGLLCVANFFVAMRLRDGHISEDDALDLDDTLILVFAGAWIAFQAFYFLLVRCRNRRPSSASVRAA